MTYLIAEIGQNHNGSIDLAKLLATDLNINIAEYAGEMFAAKSDVSRFSNAELLRMDSKEYELNGKRLRVSVLETTSPEILLSRKKSLMDEMISVAKEDRLDQVLLFIIDILNEHATLLIPNELVKSIAEKSFNISIDSDTVILPGVISRKKQIIPKLVF